MRSLITYAALVAMAAGCAVGPSYRRPDLPVPTEWRPPSPSADSLRPFFDSLRTSRDSLGPAADDTLRVPPASDSALIGRFQLADSIANLGWFDLLQDPELRRLVETALAENRDVRVALATIAEFRAQYGIARSELFPQLDVNGQGGTNKVAFGSIPPQSFDVLQATADVQWELDFWGRIRRSAEAARADLLAREESRQAVVLTLVSDVATAYLELRELDRDLEIAKSTLESRKETLRIAHRRFEQGLISELDVRQFESEVASPAARVADFERQIIQKENQLSVLVGRNPGDVPRGRPLTETLLILPVPADLPSTLLERRPDIRRAEKDLAAATARIGAAQGARLPRFSLTGQYGSRSSELSNLFKANGEIYQLFGGVAIPIFTGGRVGKQVDVARARAEQARYRYEQTVLTALREVEDALTAVRTTRDQLAAQERQANALRRSLQLATTRYQNGVSSYLEVLDAQRNLFSAELALTQAQRQQLVASVQLFEALGGGWPVIPTDTGSKR